MGNHVKKISQVLIEINVKGSFTRTINITIFLNSPLLNPFLNGTKTVTVDCTYNKALMPNLAHRN